MHNNYTIEKWVNRRNFFNDEKKFQKFGLRGEFLSI